MKHSSGQSLVEVVVGVGMMSLLLVALLALISLSVKNSRVAKNRAQAVFLAQEGIELMRTYRDFGWQEFFLHADGNDYELNDVWTVDAGGLSTTGCDQENLIYEGSIYSRCVNLDASGTDLVKVAVTVYWHEGSKNNRVLQSTNLSIWKR